MSLDFRPKNGDLLGMLVVYSALKYLSLPISNLAAAL